MMRRDEKEKFLLSLTVLFYKTNERKQKKERITTTFKGILQIHVVFFDIENMFNTLFVICFSLADDIRTESVFNFMNFRNKNMFCRNEKFIHYDDIGNQRGFFINFFVRSFNRRK